MGAAVGRLRAGLEEEGRAGERFALQWMLELSDDEAGMAAALRAHREAGVEAVLLMLGMDPADQTSVDEQLRRLERFWREVWPGAIG